MPTTTTKARRNPYPKCDGFGFRLLRAKTALEKFGRNCCAEPYSRSFDNCFEMYDGKAIVRALVERALRNEAEGNLALKRGIENMGCWSNWHHVHASTPTGKPLTFKAGSTMT